MELRDADEKLANTIDSCKSRLFVHIWNRVMTIIL